MDNNQKWIYERYSKAKGCCERKLSSYEVRIRLSDGRMICKTVSLKNFKTQKAALREAVHIRDDIFYDLRHGRTKQFEKSEEYKVNDLFNLIKDNFSLRMKTLEKYRKVYNKYILLEYGEIDIKKISAENILNTLKKCANNCLDKSVSDVKTVWHRIYEVAIRKGIDVKDLTRYIDTPKSEKEPTEKSLSEQNITEETFNDFMEYMSTYGHYLPNQHKEIYNRQIMIYILKVMRVSGMRPAETKAINRNDIKFEDITYTTLEGDECSKKAVQLYIHRSIGSTENKKVTIRSTKTNASIRTIDIDAYELFKEILEYAKYEYLFQDYDGDFISTDNLSHYLGRVRKAYKKETGKDVNFTAYTMRHSFVADMSASGARLSVIQQQVGHKPGSTVTQVYDSAPKDEQVNAVMNMERKHNKKSE